MHAWQLVPGSNRFLRRLVEPGVVSSGSIFEPRPCALARPWSHSRRSIFHEETSFTSILNYLPKLPPCQYLNSSVYGIIRCDFDYSSHSGWGNYPAATECGRAYRLPNRLAPIPNFLALSELKADNFLRTIGARPIESPPCPGIAQATGGAGVRDQPLNRRCRPCLCLSSCRKRAAKW
jgi:hypothetical protein